MYWDVIEVKVEPEFTLLVRFADGVQGKVQFMPSHFIGVFKPLSDPIFFARVFIENGALTWPNEIDLAPDALYKEIKAKGKWILT